MLALLASRYPPKYALPIIYTRPPLSHSAQTFLNPLSLEHLKHLGPPTSGRQGIRSSYEGHVSGLAGFRLVPHGGLIIKAFLRHDRTYGEESLRITEGLSAPATEPEMKALQLP